MRALNTTLLILALFGNVNAGELTRRFELSLERTVDGTEPAYNEKLILADIIPEHIRRLTNYSGDLSGRYIGNLSIISRETGRTFPALAPVVEKIISYQKPDGHFGEPLRQPNVTNDNMAMIFGQARVMVGLLEYYKLTKRPEALQAARRLGDYLVSISPLMNSDAIRQEYTLGKRWFSYPAWTQNAQGLVELYKPTKELKYLKLAEEMVDRFEVKSAVHGDYIVITIRAMVDLYNVTGEKRFLEQAIRDRNYVLNSGNVMVHGAVPEEFFPDGRRDEGCGITGWMGLNLQLWQATYEVGYLEHAERTLFNGFPFNQFSTGDFGHHVMTPTGVTYEKTKAWWCCTQSGLRAFHDVFKAVFHSNKGKLFYDLPVDGRGESEGLSVRAASSLADDRTVSLEVVKAGAGSCTLAIRKPSWTQNVNISLNGKPMQTRERAGYIELSRVWRSGDNVKASYEMITRVIQGKPGEVAILHGPWVLGVDEIGSPRYFEEPMKKTRVLLPAVGSEAHLPLEPAPAFKEAGPFAVPVAHFKLNYLPGQCPTEPETALLRPLSEHTGMRDYVPVEFWFRTQSVTSPR